MPGVLITVEGGEGAGKSTQCELLARWLRGLGHRVTETREPEGTGLGVAIRRLFEQEGAPIPLAEIFLFLAARHQHVALVVRPALARGEIVLSDRYTDATLAYQGYGRGMDLQMLRELNSLATCSIQPDLTFVLDLDPAVGFGRLGARALDAFERMDRAFHDRVRRGYLEIAREEKERVVVVRADQPRECLQEEMRRAVGEFLTRRRVVSGV